jgi:hypothetical protein
MKFNEEKFKSLREKVNWLLQKNDIAQFDKLLDEELHPLYLFDDHYHPTHVEYKNYRSIFTEICKSGNLNFVKSSIEKSSLINEETNYLISVATASGFIKACEYNHIDIVKYLVKIDKKYQHINGEDDGINLRIVSSDYGPPKLVYDVLNSALILSLYQTKNPNMELISYLFLSEELDNHPEIDFENLVKVFLKDIDLFDTLFIKNLNEDFDIRQIFNTTYVSIPDVDTVLVDVANHLIHNIKIYTYPGMEEKILEEPILNATYLSDQLNKELSVNNHNQVKGRIKI